MNNDSLSAAALLEYAAILLLLKKKRKPVTSFDEGMRPPYGEGDNTAREALVKKPVSRNTIIRTFYSWRQLKLN